MKCLPPPLPLSLSPLGWVIVIKIIGKSPVSRKSSHYSLSFSSSHILLLFHSPSQTLPNTLSGNEESRLKIVKEIFSTEESYVRSLLIVHDIYIRPLKEERVLAAEKVDVIFGNWIDLLTFHRDHLLPVCDLSFDYILFFLFIFISPTLSVRG